MKKKKIPYQSPVVCDLSGTGEMAGGLPTANECATGACCPGSGVTAEVIATGQCVVGITPAGSCIPGCGPVPVWCYCGIGGFASIG